MAHTETPWKYGVRKDESIWLSMGDPVKGPHQQFDWYGDEASIKSACLMVNAFEPMREALKELRNRLYTCPVDEKCEWYAEERALILKAIDAADAALALSDKEAS